MTKNFPNNQSLLSDRTKVIIKIKYASKKFRIFCFTLGFYAAVTENCMEQLSANKRVMLRKISNQKIPIRKIRLS